jgi:2,3-bisphosphoglycerate-dependent phosphoglycerate mutase
MNKRDRTTTLFLIRHAQSHPRASLSNMRWPLSETGKRQAAILPNILYATRITLLVSSPFERCLDTVRPYAEKFGVGIRVMSELKERRISPRLERNFEELWEKSWQDFSFKLPDGESSYEAQLRIYSAMRRICEEHTGATIGVITHGNTLGLFLNKLDPEFGLVEASRIRTPDLFRITFVDGKFHWDKDYSAPDGLEAIATDMRDTPVEFDR